MVTPPRSSPAKWISLWGDVKKPLWMVANSWIDYWMPGCILCPPDLFCDTQLYSAAPGFPVLTQLQQLYQRRGKKSGSFHEPYKQQTAEAAPKSSAGAGLQPPGRGRTGPRDFAAVEKHHGRGQRSAGRPPPAAL